MGGKPNKGTKADKRLKKNHKKKQSKSVSIGAPTATNKIK